MFLCGLRTYGKFYHSFRFRVLASQSDETQNKIGIAARGKRWANAQLQAEQKRDQFKREWAKANGYRLIEIRYDENVEEVLTRDLLRAKRRVA